MNLLEHRVLTFDVVGTLIDFETGIADRLERLAGDRGTPLDRKVLLSAFARAEHRQQRAHPELPFTRMLEPIYLELAAEVGLPTGDGAPSALRDSIPDWPAFPDAAEVLAELGRHFRLVALTNTDNWALGEHSAALGDPFHDTVTAQDVGINKPSPRMFEYCLGRQSACGYARRHVLHVAQSQYHDIAPARAVDIDVCWIERRHGTDGWGATPTPPRICVPDYHYTSLAELAGTRRRD